MARRASRLVRRTERIRLMRRMLIEALGGRCAFCSRRYGLEVDHIDGCTWVQRGVTQETRIRRYAAEYRAGVRLRPLCRSHNGSRNQSVYGTRKQRKPTRGDLIEQTEREAA